MTTDKQQAAANRLEELCVDLKDIVIRLRAGDTDAYALVYDFRSDVGKVVATLGHGIPARKRFS